MILNSQDKLAPAQHMSYTHFEVIVSSSVSAEVEVKEAGRVGGWGEMWPSHGQQEHFISY